MFRRWTTGNFKRHLNLSINKEIKSLEPLKKLKGLKAVAISGNTLITDGDLSYLETLPKLSMVDFNQRRHYSHKILKSWNWQNFNIPDKILEKR